MTSTATTTTLATSIIGSSLPVIPLPLQSKAEQELLLTYINAMHKMNPALLHNFAAAATASTNDRRGESAAAAVTSSESRTPPTPPPPAQASRPSTVAQPSNRRMVSVSVS